MILSHDNYYSEEANKEYMSVSQFKDFMKCEAAALAKLNGEYNDLDNQALLVGNFLHSYFESPTAHQSFIEDNSGTIYKKNGGMYQHFEKATEMIERLKQDDFFNFIYQGDKEVIVEGDLFGCKWKAKVDLVNHRKGYFIDLKTTRELRKRYWSDKFGQYVPFVLAYDYVLQMYVYKQLLQQQHGVPYDPYIVAVSKETPVDMAAITIDPTRYIIEEDYLANNIERVLAVKEGREEPHSCGKCPYCLSKKRLSGFIEIDQLFD